MASTHIMFTLAHMGARRIFSGGVGKLGVSGLKSPSGVGVGGAPVALAVKPPEADDRL